MRKILLSITILIFFCGCVSLAPKEAVNTDLTYGQWVEQPQDERIRVLNALLPAVSMQFEMSTPDLDQNLINLKPECNQKCMDMDMHTFLDELMVIHTLTPAGQ